MKTRRPAVTRPGSLRRRGFTLVEVLVALAVMAVLAALAWRGTDAMLRSREVNDEALGRSQRLATILTQWEQDLDALDDTGVVPALSFDGRTLRLTRGTPAGVQLVAWAVRDGVWQRWTATPVTRGGELQEQWLRSQQLLGNEATQVRLVDGVADWQIYFYRGNAWSNAQSSADLANARAPAQADAQSDAAAAPGEAASGGGSGGTGTATGTGGVAGAAGRLREVLPDGIRLVVQFTAGGTLTRDIEVAPHGS